MQIARGDIWWANLPDPIGSGPGYRRPVVVIQGDAFNRSRLATATVVILSGNTKLLDAPGNVLVSSRDSGLPRDSVANVSQVFALDRDFLVDEVGRVSRSELFDILTGIDVVLGR